MHDCTTPAHQPGCHFMSPEAFEPVPPPDRPGHGTEPDRADADTGPDTTRDGEQ